MRKIEEKMVEAFKKNQNFSLQNTRVKKEENGDVVVYLYDNVIAVKNQETTRFIDGNYPSVTTASRLRALVFETNITVKFTHGKIVFTNNDKKTTHENEITINNERI